MLNIFKKYSFVFALLACVHSVSVADVMINALIFSGSNNHKWQETTPAIIEVLKQYPSITVDVTEVPEQMTAEKLKKYDVIISNWNNFSKPELQWSDAAKKAFIDFVQNGKGHVTIHAGGSSYNDWQDYHNITAYWGEDTGHGPYHQFAVQSTNVDHPITKGIKPFTTTDELWHNTHFPAGSTVLMTAFSAKDKRGTGKDEPILTVNQFGKGRCVNLMLGHDAKAINNPGFKNLLYRSIEWAATNAVSMTCKTTDPADQRFSFETTDHSTALRCDDKIVWQFNYAKDQSKPFFHPIAMADGTVVTWDAPNDHPWHHGLWFSWKLINGINFWEEDRQTHQCAGKTEWDNVKIVNRPDSSAEITMNLSYHEPHKPTLLTEARTVKFSPIDNHGVYHIDWQSTFTAIADEVVLDRTPVPGQPDGKAWGGYAGLSFRIREGVQQSKYTATGIESLNQSPRIRCTATAAEYSGIVDNNAFGVAILDHSDNLNSPTSWYLDDGNVMDYFSPAVIYNGPHTLLKGQTLTLKYRILVHPNRWDADPRNKEYNKFAAKE